MRNASAGSDFMNSCQQPLCGFVAWVLRDEFTSEGFGEDGGGEFLDVRLGLGIASFNLVGQREQSLHSPHDCLPLGTDRFMLCNDLAP